MRFGMILSLLMTLGMSGAAIADGTPFPTPVIDVSYGYFIPVRTLRMEIFYGINASKTPIRVPPYLFSEGQVNVMRSCLHGYPAEGVVARIQFLDGAVPSEGSNDSPVFTQADINVVSVSCAKLPGLFEPWNAQFYKELKGQVVAAPAKAHSLSLWAAPMDSSLDGHPRLCNSDSDSCSGLLKGDDCYLEGNHGPGICRMYNNKTCGCENGYYPSSL